jgi:hypothetical protein
MVTMHVLTKRYLDSVKVLTKGHMVTVHVLTTDCPDTVQATAQRFIVQLIIQNNYAVTAAVENAFF